MTNRQFNFENIHRVENLTYEPLEKKYINVQVVGTVLTYIGMMLLVLFILLVENYPIVLSLLPVWKVCCFVQLLSI